MSMKGFDSHMKMMGLSDDHIEKIKSNLPQLLKKRDEAAALLEVYKDKLVIDELSREDIPQIISTVTKMIIQDLETALVLIDGHIHNIQKSNSDG